MKTNELHQVVITEDDMIDILYKGDEVNNLVVDESGWVDQFNKNCKEFGLPFVIEWSTESHKEQEQFIRDNLSDWRLPEEYQNLDVKSYLLSKCKTDQQKNRVLYELDEFNNRDMLIVLKWLTYFVDTMREHNKIWGVGRGSSVSSYVLYLIGIHKVDSLLYDLDIKEFLK